MYTIDRRATLGPFIHNHPESIGQAQVSNTLLANNHYVPKKLEKEVQTQKISGKKRNKQGRGQEGKEREQRTTQRKKLDNSYQFNHCALNYGVSTCSQLVLFKQSYSHIMDTIGAKESLAIFLKIDSKGLRNSHRS